MKKKYELTDKVIVHEGKNLYRIRALKKLNHVKIGDFGGYVESEDNLSHEGNCWIFDDSKVYEKAIVFGEATVELNSEAKGNSMMFDYASLVNGSILTNYACAFGKSFISKNSFVQGHSMIYDDARVCCSKVSDYIHVRKGAVLKSANVFGRYIIENRYIST